MKYDLEWKRKRLKNISVIMSLITDTDFKFNERSDSMVYGVVNMPLTTIIDCMDLSDVFCFNGTIMPPNGYHFDPKAAEVKINSLNGIRARYEYYMRMTEKDDIKITLQVPFNHSETALQLSDTVAAFFGRLYSMAHFMDEFGLIDDNEYDLND